MSKVWNCCTLFNSAYLTRGLSMYESLFKNYEHFHLYIFTFDQNCFDILKTLNLPKVTLITLKEFEDEELLKVKPTRTITEYCWTCTPSVLLYCLQKYNLPSCTYLDADIYFYNNPQPLIDEVDSSSILITEHRYTPKYDQTKPAGIYNVQFVGIKNDKNGLEAVTWWRERCLEWCYNRIEDGKLGDQKYLDDWLTRFKGVHVLEHLGGGMAPWNVQQYEYFIEEGKLHARTLKDNLKFTAIFFHFHSLMFFNEIFVDLGHYLKHLNESLAKIKKINSKVDVECMQKIKLSLKYPFKILKRKLYNCDNRHLRSDFI